MSLLVRVAGTASAAAAPALALAQQAGGDPAAAQPDAPAAWGWASAIWAFVVLLVLVRLLFGPGGRRWARRRPGGA